MLTDEEIMAQVLAAFQEEQAEHRQAIGSLLLDLERTPQHPNWKQMLDQLFREAHSLKGGARAAGLTTVEQIAHHIEDIFSAVRGNKLALTTTVCDSIHTAIDAVGTIMAHIADGKNEQLVPIDSVLYALKHIIEESTPQPTAETLSTSAAEPQPPPFVSHHLKNPGPDGSVRTDAAPQFLVAHPVAATQTMSSLPAEQNNKGFSLESPTSERARNDINRNESSIDTVRLSTTMLDTLLNETGELITCAVRAKQRARDAHALTENPIRWRRIWRQVHPMLSRLQERLPTFQPTIHHLDGRTLTSYALDSTTKHTSATTSGTYEPCGPDINVTVLIEALKQANDIITELEQHLAVQAQQMTEDHGRLSRVTDRLHDQIRRTRMLPLSVLLTPLRIQFREMLRVANKQVELTIDDGGAEADRQVLEHLREVLLHLLRNAIDHGIEPTDVRLALGKPAHGHIAIYATVSGDYLVLSVEDDGAGLDLRTIEQRAVHAGFLNENDLSRVSEVDLIDLIFLPGFSTRQSVNTLSGRGVGLDVVRSQIERMHGRVSVRTTMGAGSVFTINVPLSLTSSHGLLLRANEATYMLTLDSVQRIVQVTPHDIHIVEGRAAILLDERPVALVHMTDILCQRDAATSNPTIVSKSLALVLGSGDRQIACMVDAVLGERELVIHRLPAPLQRVRFVSGATILDDGTVIPILDVLDVLRTAIGMRRSLNLVPSQETSSHIPTVLVVDDSITTRTLEKNILEAAGYRVVLATDGAEALQTLYHLIENGGCDLLLSDVDMPRLNGFDLTSQIRTSSQLKHLPIVLVTSLDTSTDREQGIAAGADAYIVKRSFDQQVLLDTIAQLL